MVMVVRVDARFMAAMILACQGLFDMLLRIDGSTRAKKSTGQPTCQLESSAFQRLTHKMVFASRNRDANKTTPMTNPREQIMMVILFSASQGREVDGVQGLSRRG
jgi:hypothetical protein